MKLAATPDATPRPEAGKQRRNALAVASGFNEALKAGKGAKGERTAEIQRDVPSMRWAKLAAALEAVAPETTAAKTGIAAAVVAGDMANLVFDPENEAKNDELDTDETAIDAGDQKTRNGIDAIFAAILLKEPASAPAVVVQTGQAMNLAEGDTSGEPEAEAGEGDLPEPGAITPRQGVARDDGNKAQASAVATTVTADKAEAGRGATSPTVSSTSAAAGDTTQASTSASLSPVAAAASAPTASDDRNAEAKPVSAKVTVLGEQSIPAPAAQPTPTTGALVDTLAGDAGWRAAVRDVAPMQHGGTHPGAAPVHTLKLQLHPAELGMVTANLKFIGEQLSIEIQVENAEAYNRLSGDTDTIIKSLRAMGYEIDQVSVQQPQQAVNSNARAETNTGTQGGMQRDAQSFASGNSGGNGDRLGGQGSGRERGNGGEHRETGGQTRQERSERGLYI